MTVLGLIWSELVGMFIDDGALALLALVLVAVVTVLVKLFALPGLWGALVLLVGCLAILADSVRRAARKRSSPPSSIRSG